MRLYGCLFRLVLTLATACFLILPISAVAQSLTTGSVTGTVTDPSDAAVAGATVNLKNNHTGATQSATTTGTGAYRRTFAVRGLALLASGVTLLPATALGSGNTTGTIADHARAWIGL